MNYLLVKTDSFLSLFENQGITQTKDHQIEVLLLHIKGMRKDLAGLTSCNACTGAKYEAVYIAEKANTKS